MGGKAEPLATIMKKNVRGFIWKVKSADLGSQESLSQGNMGHTWEGLYRVIKFHRRGPTILRRWTKKAYLTPSQLYPLRIEAIA